MTLRGDTNLLQTKHLDRWDAAGVRFIFGIDAKPNLVEAAESLPKAVWRRLKRPPKYENATEVRRRPEKIKDIKVIEREFENIRLRSEEVTPSWHRPVACERSYRIVVVRKNLTIEKGALHLFDDIRYFFDITDDVETAAVEIVLQANDRCNQENLIAQLKGVHATRMPVDTLRSNWACMVMASLAWTLMEFRTFLNAFMRLPAQVLRTGRRIVFRLLSWNRWQHVFLRATEALAGLPLRR